MKAFILAAGLGSRLGRTYKEEAQSVGSTGWSGTPGPINQSS